jgi:hypothetical protein
MQQGKRFEVCLSLRASILFYCGMFFNASLSSMMKVAGQNLNLNAKCLREHYVLLLMIECRDNIEGQR